MPVGDVQETSNYVAAMERGIAMIKTEGLPLSSRGFGRESIAFCS